MLSLLMLRPTTDTLLADDLRGALASMGPCEAWCSRAPNLHLEVLALRHQLQVLHRSRPRRLRLGQADRWLSAWLLRVFWNDWRTALVIVKPETVIAWHRCGFRFFWTWKSCRGTYRIGSCSASPPGAATRSSTIWAATFFASPSPTAHWNGSRTAK
jgi:hypothetical protein